MRATGSFLANKKFSVHDMLIVQDLLSYASVVHVRLFPEIKKGFHLIKSYSASILLHFPVFLSLAVKFGMESWTLLQPWYSRQRGDQELPVL